VSLALSNTIIILTKDRPALLPRAVASACRARRAGSEILVIDDCSMVPATEVLSPRFDLEREKIRVLRRPQPGGISAARNMGIEAARGEVIFFLDDDDELQPDYCETILSGPARQHDYGFSAFRLIGKTGVATQPRPRFATGPIPTAAPLRKQLCGMGMGFWIRREVALAAGPFATELLMNEDTDFVCRLIEQGRRAWYSAEPGVDVHQHAEAGNLGNITGRVLAQERAQAMLFVCNRYPAMAAHLGRSYLRHCAKSGLRLQGSAYIRRQRDLWLRLNLSLYFLTKMAVHRAARRSA